MTGTSSGRYKKWPRRQYIESPCWRPLSWIREYYAKEKFADYVGYYCEPSTRNKIPDYYLEAIEKMRNIGA